jgi:hypothetical protein
MSHKNVNLTSLDFDTLKSSLKVFLEGNEEFQDYDFDASNMSVLLDLLAYNTQLNAFYLNMIGNEMFLDSAQLRDSVVSHAKELNYLPRSFRSAYANIDLTITSTDLDKTIITVPKGTSFTSRSGSKNYTFVTDQNIVINGVDGTFTKSNICIYEGDYITDSYVINDSTPVRYLLTNRTVDTNSITVSVIEDNGATTLSYTVASSLFDLDETSQVFFIQAGEDEKYEIVFGDGVIGRKPKDNSVVVIDYRASSGELPNGLRLFTSDGSINGESTITIVVNEAAKGGAVSESVTSIKFNAPRAFTRQERAITASDYETLLTSNFSEINDIVAYGGEEASPPRYGKVIISVDLQDSDLLPPSNRDIYTSFIKQRSPLSIDPVFVAPTYTYLDVVTNVRYNINETSLSPNDIETLVTSAILNYNTDNLDGFKKTLRYSQFLAVIDDAAEAVISNDTEVRMVKRIIPTLNTLQNISVDFATSLRNDISTKGEIHPQDEVNIITSSQFQYKGLTAFFEDDGNGILRIMTLSGDNHVGIEEIGTVDYDLGMIQINSFSPESFTGNYVKIFATVRDRDIAATKNTILSVANEDIRITVEQVRI